MVGVGAVVVVVGAGTVVVVVRAGTVVVVVARLLVARAAVAEVVLLDDAGLFEQADRPVDGGDGYVRVDGGGAAVELLHVGMVVAL